MRAGRRSLVGGLAVISTGTLGWLAVDADRRAVSATVPVVLLDLAVGVAFPVAALVSRGPAMQRLLIGAVGLTWLAGSVLAPARSFHQGALVVALVAFPAGRVRGAARWLAVAAATVVMTGFVPQLGVAVVFVGVALTVGVAATGSGLRRAAGAFPALSAVTVAAVLLFTWWSVRHQTAVAPLVLYGITLLGVAAGFPVATVAAGRAPTRLTDDVLSEAPVAGVAGLRSVLARTLADPDLTISVVGEPSLDRVSGRAGHGSQASATAPALTVYDADEPLARVVSASSALGDRGTAEAVAAAVRLTVLNSRLGEAQSRLAADLEASRVRLLAAIDRERQRIAVRLDTEVRPRLDQAQAILAGLPPDPGPDVASVAIFGTDQIAAAAHEVSRIVAGIAPADLGDGRLRHAIEDLAHRSLIPTTCRLDPEAAGSPGGEQALFYVCGEAIANATKHSRATVVTVDLAKAGDELVLSVVDNGIGGADPRGSGLQGLADRLAAAGGALSITSPTGQGTAVVARVPSRS